MATFTQTLATTITASIVLGIAGIPAATHGRVHARAVAASSSRSAGCGVSATGTGRFVTRSIDVGGVTRTYRRLVPASYDPNRAYPLVFKWHGYGGNGLSGGLGIEHSSREDAILVSGDGLNASWDHSATSPDLAYFDAMLAEVSRAYCIDTHRVFSAGFSMGGGFSNLLACVRGHVLRAHASIAGFDPGPIKCSGRTATWLLHDANDDAVPVANGIAVRDRAVRANDCGAETTPEPAPPCVRYSRCDADLPVVWCESSGYGHNIRSDFAPPLIWAFFEELQ